MITGPLRREGRDGRVDDRVAADTAEFDGQIGDARIGSAVGDALEGGRAGRIDGDDEAVFGPDIGWSDSTRVSTSPSAASTAAVAGPLPTSPTDMALPRVGA